jgi:hypothetical protein
MKITKSQLRQIIREEVALLNEQGDKESLRDRFVQSPAKFAFSPDMLEERLIVLMEYLVPRGTLKDAKFRWRIKNDADFRKEFLSRIDVEVAESDETFLGDLENAINKFKSKAAEPSTVASLILFLAKQGLL